MVTKLRHMLADTIGIIGYILPENMHEKLYNFCMAIGGDLWF